MNLYLTAISHLQDTAPGRTREHQGGCASQRAPGPARGPGNLPPGSAGGAIGLQLMGRITFDDRGRNAYGQVPQLRLSVPSPCDQPLALGVLGKRIVRHFTDPDGFPGFFWAAHDEQQGVERAGVIAYRGQETDEVTAAVAVSGTLQPNRAVGRAAMSPCTQTAPPALPSMGRTQFLEECVDHQLADLFEVFASAAIGTPDR